MLKKNKYILIFILLIGIFFFFLKSNSWNQFLAEQNIKFVKSIGHNRIEAYKAVYFGHKNIDSLYNVKEYKYIYFIPNKTNNISLIQDSILAQTLKVYSNKDFLMDEMDENSLLLPYHLFEYLTVNELPTLYTIVSVDKQHSDFYLFKIVKKEEGTL